MQITSNEARLVVYHYQLCKTIAIAYYMCTNEMMKLKSIISNYK